MAKEAQRDRPPKLQQCATHLNAHSIQSFLQFLHGECLHCLRGWLGLEDARFLCERVDALLGWSGGLLLQLQVQESCQLEISVLLDLSSCHREESINDALHLLRFQSSCLRNRSCNL